MTQRSLFDELPEEPSKRNGTLPLDRFVGAMLCSTIGDALGWPTEFLQPDGRRKPSFELPVHDFIEWKKLVGGKWWGYEQKVGQGEYSDDTQLTLAIARCISEDGRFEPEKFAYEELPLWLQYERGGGKSIKAAARKLVARNANWQHNFYKQKEFDYKSAGANGAAMRTLPIALVNVNNETQQIRDSFLNSIITHGHPRAIIGAILFGLAVNYALTTSNGVEIARFYEYISHWLEQTGKAIAQDERIMKWMYDWNRDKQSQELPFQQLFNSTRKEAMHYLQNIQKLLNAEPQAYYTLVGALKPETKGSGLATVCVAIYMFLKYIDRPEEGLVTATNMFGSDTDTIGVFLGALLGAYHGTKAIRASLLDRVQDGDYLRKTASRLHAIASGEQDGIIFETEAIDRRDAYFKILAWEIGFHEMFWDETEIDAIITHPTLGRGTILDKEKKPVRREGYEAKLIHVRFDCGQTCIFHSRVENNEKVSESLAQDVVKALTE